MTVEMIAEYTNADLGIKAEATYCTDVERNPYVVRLIDTDADLAVPEIRRFQGEASARAHALKLTKAFA